MRKFKTQVANEGEYWGVTEAFDIEEAVRQAVIDYIWDNSAFELIGKETITVHVDDGIAVTTWNADTEHSFDTWVTMKE
jgi:hypothetical protein